MCACSVCLHAASAVAVPATMRAWYVNEYISDMSHLKFSSAYAIPVAKAGEVLIQVMAASVQPVDYKIITQPDMYPTKLSFPYIPGHDGAGIVAAVGDGISDRFKVGDAVWFKASGGAYADYVAVLEANVDVKPTTLSFENAGSLPGVGTTSAGAFLRGDANIPLKDATVLVLGGSGGTGSVAVQIAKHHYEAAEVFTTSSAANADWLRSLGADKVIDYHTLDWWNDSVIQNGTVDFVFDTIGQSGTAPRAMGKLKSGGVFVTIVHHGPDVGLDPNPPSDRVQIFALGHGAKLSQLKDLVDTAALKPSVQASYNLAQTTTAWNVSADGHVNGKLVLAIGAAACSTRSACAALADDCCPTAQGVMLACCHSEQLLMM